MIIKKAGVVLVMFSFLFVFAAVGYAVPIQWELSNGGNDHWYEAVTSAVDWQTALDLAESSTFNGMQGSLVTLTSEAESSWVWSNLGDVSGYFLGGSDESEEGVWQWTTGEQWVYSNWNSGEPNNVPWLLVTGEDGLQFASNGMWNDIPVTGYYGGGYIIEYSLNSVPEPATFFLLGLGLIGLVGAGRKNFKK